MSKRRGSGPVGTPCNLTRNPNRSCWGSLKDRVSMAIDDSRLTEWERAFLSLMYHRLSSFTVNQRGAINKILKRLTKPGNRTT